MVDVMYTTRRVLCRACAQTEFGVPIFSFLGEQLQLLHQISFCLGIRVLENDNLPKHICYICLGRLTSFFQFKQMCVSAQSQIPHLMTEISEAVSITPVKNGDSGVATNLTNSPTLNGLSNVDKDNSGLNLMIQNVQSLAAHPPKTLTEIPSSTTAEKRKNTDLTPEEKAARKKERKTVCMECGLWMPRYEIVEHEEKVHFKRDYFCLRCQKDFVTQPQWAKHVEEVHSEAT